MSKIFGRQARLTIGSLQVDSEGNHGLRFAFQIRKSTKLSENSARIMIFNLSEDTRARLSEDASRLERGIIRQIVLEAGYQGDVRQLFAGDRAWISHARTGTEWVTTVETIDGVRALNTQVNFSFSPGVSAKQIFEKIVGEVGLAWEQIKKGGTIVDTLSKLVFDGGKTVTGSARAQFRRLAAEAGLDVSVQDGELVLYQTGGESPNTGLELTADTGLIGTPETFLDPSVKTKNESGPAKDSPFSKNANLVRGKCLLNGLMSPGRRFLLDSKSAFANAGATFGVFRAINVDHVGDTHGADESWFTAFEAEEVSSK